MKSLSSWLKGVNASSFRRLRDGMFLCLVVLLACGAPVERPHGTFVIGIEKGPSTLDPRLAIDAYSSKICQLIYAGLFRLNESLELTPDLLESYEPISSLEYRFVLRPGIKFHDGSELTSHDVAFTYNSIRNQKVPSPRYGTFSKIQSIDVLDNLHFTIVLKEPFAPFLNALTLGIMRKPVNRHASEKDSPESRVPGPASEKHSPESKSSSDKEGVGVDMGIVGAGAFQLVEHVPDEKVVLRRFDHYVAGKPRAKEIIFKVVRDDNLRVLDLVRGNLDLLQNSVPAALIPHVKGRSDLVIESVPGINYSYMGFNLDDPYLSKEKVRQAFAHAINIPEVIDYKLRGFAREATGILSPVHWAYVDPGIRYPYDPEKAKALLNEAGFPDPDGPGPQSRFRVIYKTSSKRDRVGLARLFAQYLQKVGVEVLVTPYEWGTLFRDIRTGNFQLYTLTWVGVTEPDIYYDTFNSSQIPPEGANRNRYRNGAMDQLTAEGRVVADQNKRKEIYAEVQKIAARELPYLSLWYEDVVVVRRKDVKGYRLYPNASFRGLTDIYRK